MKELTEKQKLQNLIDGQWMAWQKGADLLVVEGIDGDVFIDWNIKSGTHPSIHMPHIDTMDKLARMVKILIGEDVKENNTDHCPICELPICEHTTEEIKHAQYQDYLSGAGDW